MSNFVCCLVPPPAKGRLACPVGRDLGWGALKKGLTFTTIYYKITPTALFRAFFICQK